MKLFKHPIKETLNNYRLRWNAFKVYLSKPNNRKGMVRPANYKKVFYDDFSDRLDGSKWRLGQPWGNFHPGSLHQHYDTRGIETYVSNDKKLILELRHRPLEVDKSQLPDWRQGESISDKFQIPYAVGLVTTKESWQYGWFEAEIKLPKGKPLWPAFWLTGKNSWPPEIDILEAYSRCGSDYRGRFLFKKRPFVKIQPNLHYGSVEGATKAMYGAYDVPVWNATGRFIQYACWWERDFIKIYYDGMLVFECTDPEVLKWYNASNSDQIIVINNGIQYDGTVPDECAMEVKRVAVYQQR